MKEKKNTHAHKRKQLSGRPTTITKKTSYILDVGINKLDSKQQRHT